MEIKSCRDCLYYDECIRNVEYEYPDNPHRLKDRIYNIFVEGRDCFYGINRDLE